MSLQAFPSNCSRRGRAGLGVLILVAALAALAVEIWMIPALRFWDPQNDPVRRGMTAYNKGDYETAIAAFTEAIQRNRQLVQVYNYRGTCYRLTKRLDLAMADFDKAAQLNPGNAAAYYNRAVVYMIRREHQRAIAEFDESLKRNRTYAPSFISRGIAYRSLGEYEKAFADFDEAIRLAPTDPGAYESRGYSFGKKGEYAKAMADFNKAVTVAPNKGNGYNSLAWLFATCPQDDFRDGKKAVEHANTACRLTDWNDPRNIDTLAAAYAEAGDFEQAVKWQAYCLEMKSLPPESVDDYRSRLTLYEARKPFRNPYK